MNSIRKWFYRPRRDDTSLMAQFYYADEELNLVAGELDSFDGRKDPERCTALVNQLRQAQDKVLNICVEMMDDLLADERAPRDFRVKFPDDVMQETLCGQLWFGAECLAAGSSILNRETESTRMRPLAKAVTKTIDNVRNLLREQCLKPIPEYTEKIRESLKIFDKLFADFELSYVSAMVPVKTVQEFEMQQTVAVLFSDTLQRAVKLDLVNQDQIDNYDPALMFTIPRLAIVSGLVIFPDGPLNVEKDSKSLSELFRPFKTLLLKIRELLWTMSPQELATLEKCLCSMEEPDINIQSLQKDSPVTSSVYLGPVAYTSDFVHRFYTNYPSCRQLTPDMISLCSSGKKLERGDRKRDRNSSKHSRTRARLERQSERFLSRLTGIEERPRARRRRRAGSSHSHSQHQHPQPHPQPHPHYYQYPEHFQDYGPSSYPYSTPEENVSHCNTAMTRPSNILPRASLLRHAPIGVNTEQPRVHPNYSNRHQHRSRQSCHSPQNRDDRISTIVCACGTATNHTSTDQAQNNERFQSELSPVGELVQSDRRRSNDCHCPNPDNCPVNRNPSYLDSSEYQDQSSYYYPSHDVSMTQDYPSNAESQDHRMDVSRPSANIQNCVTNAVNADPSFLSPNSLYDQDNVEDPSTIPPPPTPPPPPTLPASDTPTSPEPLNLDHSEESLATETTICDECNNSQCNGCDTFVSCDNSLNASEQSKEIKDESEEKTCVCSSTGAEEQDSNEGPSIVDDVILTPQDEVLTQIPPEIPPDSNQSHTSPESVSSHTHKLQCKSETAPHSVAKDLERGTEEAVLQNDSSSHDRKRGRNKKASKAMSRLRSRPEEEVDDDDESSGSTSPHHSGPEDDEEVALALQAAEVAVSWKARERFSDPGDLIQRLFVCISGVADQLQTNHASDLRKILRSVFVMNQTEDEESVEIVVGKEHFPARRDASNEDVTSTNGSEQLSVESAEDALEIIGTPEIGGGRLNSPDEVSDIEEEENSLNFSSHSDDSVPRPVIHTSSVIVPPSVFNDHSHMQYSSMSPPPFFADHTYASLVDTRDALDTDTLRNEVPSSAYLNSQDASLVQDIVFNLNTISDSLNYSISNLSLEPVVPVPMTTAIPVTASPENELSGGDLQPSIPMSDVYGSDASSPVQLSPQTLPEPPENTRRYPIVQEPPSWIPDHLAPRCMACGALFTVVRRRHHCRNCGKVFCGHCSRHSVPLPHFGIWKNVRVCNACFLYYVTSSADGSSALS